MSFKALKPWQNGRYYANDNFKYIFLSDYCCFYLMFAEMRSQESNQQYVSYFLVNGLVLNKR